MPNKEDIIRMAREAKLPYYYRTGEVSNLDQLERFFHMAQAAEREACAKLIESRKTGANELMDAVRDMEAKAIRARGQE
jgi:hypothetical protein